MFEVAKNLFNVHVLERLRGEDYWIPTDPNQMAEIPKHQVRSHGIVEQTGPFSVRSGAYGGKDSTPVHHVCFTWKEMAEASQITYSASSSKLTDKKDGGEGVKVEEVRSEQKTLVEVGTYEWSLFRSHDLHEAIDVFQSCLNCKALFDLIDTQTELKRLMQKLQAHPLWHDVHIAARLGSTAFFQKFKPHDPELIKLFNTPCQPEGQYPLHIVIFKNYIELTKLMIDMGASISKTDIDGSNALHYAAKSSAAILDAILSYPAGKDVLNAIDKEGCTPLFVAVRAGNPICMHTLTKHGAELNIRCKGRSPLFETMTCTDSAKARKVIAAMLEASSDLLNEKDPQTGNTALHVATGKEALGAVLMQAAKVMNVNERNLAGQTPLHVHTHRGDLGSVILMASYNAQLDAKDVSGNTALHLAVSGVFPDIIKGLLVLGADPNIVNTSGHSARHLAAKLKSGFRVLSDIREFKQKKCVERMRLLAEEVMQDPSKTKSALVNLISFDGGGIRGLVITQILIAIEDKLGKDFFAHFDWAAGTSTGSYVAAALAAGFSLRDCQRIYLRFKDQVFEGWARPYNTTSLETLIKNEFSAEKVLSDFKHPKLMITTVKADKVPISLELRRNYRLPLSDAENNLLGYRDPKEELLWKTLRCSSAAPTYFSTVDGMYIDGGMIANNPTLELMSEVEFWNTAVEYHQAKKEERGVGTGEGEGVGEEGVCPVEVGMVVSIGTGKIPDNTMPSLDFDISSGMVSSVTAIKNLGMIFVDQVTATEGCPVERARSWCHSQKIPFFRLSTPMKKEIPLDTKDDVQLVSLMWDTVEYMHEEKEEVDILVQVLQYARTIRNR